MSAPFMQIGEVAALVGLSLRTIRHYEEVGLVVPSGRSQGGFRLYTDTDVDRLRRVRRMKPFFSLEETADLLSLLDGLGDTEPADDGAGDRLLMYRDAVLARVGALREQVAQGEDLADELIRVRPATAPGARRAGPSAPTAGATDRGRGPASPRRRG